MQREASVTGGFLSRTLQLVSSWRSLLFKAKYSSEKWDVVLLGTYENVVILLIVDFGHFRRSNGVAILV